MNRIFQISPFQENINNKIFQSQNLKNSYSDLHTSASFNSQKSAESFFSHNNNKSQFIPTNFALMPNNNFNLYPTHRKVASSVDYPIDLNNNYFYRNNLSSKGLTNLINNTIINQKTNQNLSQLFHGSFPFSGVVNRYIVAYPQQKSKAKKRPPSKGGRKSRVAKALSAKTDA